MRWIRTGISLIQEKQFIFSTQFLKSLLSGISNLIFDASVDIVDDEGLFQF